jgi:hypothetical protein
MKSDQKETDGAPVSETPVRDKRWGDSVEGPVRGEGDVVPPSATGASERMLQRDARRDPWSGPPVQDTDDLPSGYYRDRVPAEGYNTDVPDDEKAGGNAGIVGEDERLIDRGK